MELKRSPKSWAEVELPEARKTIKAQAVELDRLRALLGRWNVISPTLADLFTSYEFFEDAPGLKKLIADTSETLK